jgi:hypothetical protein
VRGAVACLLHATEGDVSMSIRGHLSYANVMATVAVVFAMGGSAVAASHYLITSTKQIRPSVLKSLKGKTGAPGAPGVAGKEGTPGKEGAQGLKGPPGPEGKEGPLVNTLPSGKTETGIFFGSDYEGEKPKAAVYAIAPVSFQFPLASEPKVEIIQEGGKPTANCPGSVAKPSAAKGYFCAYVWLQGGTGNLAYEAAAEFLTQGLVLYGVGQEENHTAQIAGAWAVTAP